VKCALVGHSGFVGRNLQRRRSWDACFDRGNIDSIRGRSFDRIVCAGLPADRWLANGNPGGDRSNMLSLAGALAEAHAGRFVLVSTVDVYPIPVGVDESTPFETGSGQAYAEHRLEFERIVARLFDRCHVLRLPATFGPGARGNPLVDLVRQRDLDAIDPAGSLQWYPVERLADDVDRAIAHEIPLANLCSGPVPIARLHRAFFDDLRIGGRPGPSIRQDVRSLHARVFGGDDRYAIDAEEVVVAIGGWLRALGQFGEPV
jgi:hypothetical protein